MQYKKLWKHDAMQPRYTYRMAIFAIMGTLYTVDVDTYNKKKYHFPTYYKADNFISTNDK